MKRRELFINGLRALPFLGHALAQKSDMLPQRKSIAARVATTLEKTVPKEGVLINRKDLPPERIQDALSHIRTALVNVKKDTDVAKDLWSILPGREQQEAFFLAMAMKESKVHPNPPLPPSVPHGAKKDSVGYFQVRETAVEEVNRIFSKSLGKTYSHEDIPTAPIAGSETGILYFVLSVRQAMDSFPNVTDPEERLKLSLVMYNGGQGNIEALMRNAFVRPKRYESLYEYLNALALSGAPLEVQARIAAERRVAKLGKTQRYAEIPSVRDTTYPVDSKAGDGVQAYLENKAYYDDQAEAKNTIPGLKDKDGKDFKGRIAYWKPAILCRYAELIPAMARKIQEKELSQLSTKTK